MKVIKLKEPCITCGCRYFFKQWTNSEILEMIPNNGYAKISKEHKFQCGGCNRRFIRTVIIKTSMSPKNMDIMIQNQY